MADRIRAVFARDEFEFWWRHFTDEERTLRRMDVWELAEVISQNPPDSPKHIVAEHLLNLRLTRMQTRATYVSVVIGLVGVVVGAVLSKLLD